MVSILLLLPSALFSLCLLKVRPEFLQGQDGSLLRGTSIREGGHDVLLLGFSLDGSNEMTSQSMRQRQPVDGPEETSVKDRRGRRIEISCRIFFFGDDELEGEAKLLDISTHGCRASTSIELTTGMVLKLPLFLDDHKWPLRVDEAIVRWIEGQEFGLEFTSIRLAQRERLRTLIIRARP